MATAMSPALRGLLKRNDVDEKVITGLETEKCYEIGHFAKWVDTAAELVTVVLEPLGLKQDMPQRARLKLAWAEAEAIHAKSLKRTAEGQDPTDLNEPLDPGTSESLQQAWNKAHNWPPLPAAKVANATIKGRIHRLCGIRW